MDKWYKKRYQQHQRRMMKYLKYVFSDHFMIVLFFMLGGAVLYYSQWLHHQHMTPLMTTLGIAIIDICVLRLGKVALLLHPADEVFLLVKEQQMCEYFQRAIRTSFVLPACVLISVQGMLYPLMAMNLHFTLIQLGSVTLALLALKASQLYAKVATYYYCTMWNHLQYIWELVAVSIALVAPFIGVIVALIGMVVAHYSYQALASRQLLHWKKGIADEEQRMMRWYKWIQLFTDVPNMPVQTKRRRYLDWIVKRITPTQAHTYTYIFVRQFIRTNTYSGLYIRLTAISMLGVYFIPQFYMKVCISALFLYLLLLQLLPLYQSVDAVLMTQLYPIAPAMKQRSLQHIMLVLGLGFILFNSCMAIVQITWSQLGIMCVILFLVLYVCCYWYTKKKVQAFDSVA